VSASQKNGVNEATERVDKKGHVSKLLFSDGLYN